MQFRLKPTRISGTAALGAFLAIFTFSGFPAVPAAEAGDQGRGRDRSSGQQQMRFRAMDLDGDGVITRAEWRGNMQSFRQHDRNNDGVLSGDEVWVDETRTGAPQDLAEVFARADRNDDRLLSRSEWYGDLRTFERLDRDDDGRISLSEFIGEEGAAGTSGPVLRFNQVDRNGNGVITPSEWTGSRESFAWLDADNDGVITRSEYREGAPVDPDSLQDRSEAYRAGYNRGLTEGRQAGSQDKQRRNQWDLEGQRELEQADSGYYPALGDRAEYQAGYRAGFRRGYTLGFGPR